MADFEKELAVLKGRVDGLEAKVGELESSQRSIHYPGVLIIDCYNLATEEIKKSAKVIHSTMNLNRWRRLSSQNSGLFASYNSAVILENSNESGDYPLIEVRHYGDLSFTGKELVMGGGYFDGEHFYNHGTIPAAEGSYMIINKQKI